MKFFHAELFHSSYEQRPSYNIVLYSAQTANVWPDGETTESLHRTARWVVFSGPRVVKTNRTRPAGGCGCGTRSSVGTLYLVPCNTLPSWRVGNLLLEPGTAYGIDFAVFRVMDAQPKTVRSQ